MAKESMSSAPAFNLGSLAATLASVTDPRVAGRQPTTWPTCWPSPSGPDGRRQRLGRHLGAGEPPEGHSGRVA